MGSWKFGEETALSEVNNSLHGEEEWRFGREYQLINYFK